MVDSRMTLGKLMVAFDTDEECRAGLEYLRWPNGVTCLRCGSGKISRIKTRKQFDCDACRYRFSVTTGTAFHDSHLALPKWFMAVLLMCKAKKGISANQMKRTLGVAMKTAWYLCHRIREAMKDDNPEMLSGTVEVEETYIGGRKRGIGRGNYKRDGNIRITTGKSTTGDVHTNSVEGAFGLFRRSIVGSFHQVSPKHLDRYLDEFEFRYNNRKSPYLFRDTILKLINATAVEYKKLIA
jgi:transposase-like protein